MANDITLILESALFYAAFGFLCLQAGHRGGICVEQSSTTSLQIRLFARRRPLPCSEKQVSIVI